MILLNFRIFILILKSTSTRIIDSINYFSHLFHKVAFDKSSLQIKSLWSEYNHQCATLSYQFHFAESYSEDKPYYRFYKTILPTPNNNSSLVIENTDQSLRTAKMKGLFNKPEAIIYTENSDAVVEVNDYIFYKEVKYTIDEFLKNIQEEINLE